MPDSARLDALAGELLTAIEVRESRLLNWGFMQVQDNLRDCLPELLAQISPRGCALWESAQRDGVRGEDLLANLLERKLLFQGGPGGTLYRSRFAEAIRLLNQLRQRFSDADWQSAPTLVSDLKIQLQRRRYPVRDVTLEALLADLDVAGVGLRQRQAVSALLTEGDGAALHLAAFQREAILRLFRCLRESHDRGIVIGAGTGAGKTKAFYVPALAEIAAGLNHERWLRGLALYPRVELLKDQLAEALAETAKLAPLLASSGKRGIVLGVYYGDTPTSARALLDYGTPGWTDNKQSFICPFVTCPTPDCKDEALVWNRSDVEKEVQANAAGRYGHFALLRCPRCGYTLGGDRLALTREHMVRQPPDMLFTTAEMLNRRLGRAREHALFGVGVLHPPRLMLLDEIHTYEGLYGAQIAYLLRRWRHARGHARGLCVVGLSATLADADGFFARLTGLPQYHVDYITPRDEDMEEQGIEYNIMVKGDPVSGTSLLSTSVQTVMLIARILDQLHQPVSRGAYGQRVFAFTDKLDVINRWYHIEVDAETRKKLSRWRDLSPTLDQTARMKRRLQGQDWSVCRLIGHDLKDALRLGLTSSQHRGVEASADLVIATSTLEVGYNDPTVGAVVQHKAPRSIASFLQRKGRAGRTRVMRPWMVVVASAYGRDRWAFQHMENLFAPSLQPLSLPIANYYVRQVQGAFAFIDWLAQEARPAGVDGDVWNLLSSDGRAQDPKLTPDRRRLADVLHEVLSGARLHDLTSYIRQALGLQDDDAAVEAILWGEPRPLLLDVVPTLLRQLETNWQAILNGMPRPWSDSIADAPLPDFVPASLFSDLNLPEVRLRLPAPPPPRGAAAHNPQAQTAEEDEGAANDQYLPLGPALMEFAPGNVSKRFAARFRTQEAHWLAIPSDAVDADSLLDIGALAIDHDGAQAPCRIEDVEYQVIRPRRIGLSLVPSNVRNTSSGRLVWRSHFAPRSLGGPAADDDGRYATQGAGRLLTLAPSSPWRRCIESITAYTQASGSCIDVTRLAVGVDVETRLEGGSVQRRSLRFGRDGQPAALGFTLAVDGLAFGLAPFEPERITALPTWPSLLAHLRPEFFRHKLLGDPVLRALELSFFEVQWLAELELAMIVATAIARRCTLEEAAAHVAGMREELAERTMAVIFQTQQVDGDADDAEGRLHKCLRDLVALPDVQESLRRCETVLWTDRDDDLLPWLASCYRSSVGAALYTALVRLVPDIDADDLVLDITDDTVWITEAAAGGVGLAARVAEALALHPRDVELQLRDTLEHCPREQIAVQLGDLVRLIEQQDQELAEVFAQVRASSDLPSQLRTRRLLMRALEAHGIPVTRELIVAVLAKVLRPNSEADSDQLMADVVRLWDEEEERLGCAIDLRVLAVAAPRVPAIEQQIDDVFTRVSSGDAPTESQVFNVLQSMLWLRCTNSCPDCIETYQPYQNVVRPSRALLRRLLIHNDDVVRFETEDWASLVQQRLSSHFQVQVVCAQQDLEECKLALADVLVTPIDVGYQLLYPVVERIGRSGSDWQIGLVVREMVHG